MTTPLIGRRLCINTVVRRHQVEATRTRSLMADEYALHDPRTAELFSETVRHAIPDARITWGMSWQALRDRSTRYRDLRSTVARIAATYGDEITFVPGGFFANVYNSRSQVDRDIADGLAAAGDLGGAAPRSLLAGFLAAENVEHAADRHGIRAVQGNVWSQFDIDLQDGDGSIAYPYYPSRRHFLVPGRGQERIPAVMLDGWTVDLVAARGGGVCPDGSGNWLNSRLGIGPIETLHQLPADSAMRELQLTSQAHLCDANVQRNGLGWLTVNYEICEVARALAQDPNTIRRWGEWLSWLREQWPDLRVPTMSDFASEWMLAHHDNDQLAYVLTQQGSGIGASRAGQRVVWFMNRDFRLGVVYHDRCGEIFDYTSYLNPPPEPTTVGERRWSLLGEINQKRTRPQDDPVPIGRFLSCHPQVAGGLIRWHTGIVELSELLADGSDRAAASVGRSDRAKAADG